MLSGDKKRRKAPCRRSSASGAGAASRFSIGLVIAAQVEGHPPRQDRMN
jgi:hypothetical protein